MKIKRLMTGIAALCASASIASAYDISLSVFAVQGIWVDSFGGTLLPAGASYQLFWSADSTYESSGISETDANLTSGLTSTGDYVIFTGNTAVDGGWAVDDLTPQITNGDVGGNTVSSGFVYGYVYFDSVADGGDQYVRSPIYGPPTPTWGDADQGDPPDQIDFAPGTGNVMAESGLVVTPEPGTMALFGIGMLTMAVRRRRK